MPVILDIPRENRPCWTHGFDFYQAGLRSDSGPAGEATISLTMEFPLLSSPIHDAAPYGRQTLLHRHVCALRKVFFFFFESNMI